MIRHGLAIVGVREYHRKCAIKWHSPQTFAEVLVFVGFAMQPTKRRCPEPATNDALAAVNSSLRELGAILRNRRRREAYATVMPPLVRRGALMLMCRTSGDVKQALAFVAFKCARTDEVLQEWGQKLVKWFGEMSLEQKLAFQTGEGLDDDHIRATKALDKYMKEKSLHEWTDIHNQNTGVAPSTSVLSQKLLPLGLAPKDKVGQGWSGNRRSKLQYLRRWRKRWNISLGSIQPRDVISDEDLQIKAFRTNRKSVPEVDPNQLDPQVLPRGSKCAATMRLPIWSRELVFCYRGGLENGTTSGSLFRLDSLCRRRLAGNGAIGSTPSFHQTKNH